jgi:hypothetical protein
VAFSLLRFKTLHSDFIPVGSEISIETFSPLKIEEEISRTFSAGFGYIFT